MSVKAEPASRCIPSFARLRTIELDSAARAELQRAAVYASRIGVAGRSVAFAFCSAAACAELARRYTDQPSETTGPSFFFFCVRDTEDTYFWSTSGQAWIWDHGELTDHDLVFLTDIAAWFSYFQSSLEASLHAAVVGDGRSAAAIVGESTAGKTTTAVACMQVGLRLLSDERCVVRDGIVAPFLRTLTIRRGARAMLAAQIADDDGGIAERMRAWNLDGEISTPPSRIHPKRIAREHMRLRRLFVLGGYADEPCAERCDLSAIIPALTLSLVSRETGLARPARLYREFDGVPCYKLTLGTPLATAAMIHRMLVESGTAG